MKEKERVTPETMEAMKIKREFRKEQQIQSELDRRDIRLRTGLRDPEPTQPREPQADDIDATGQIRYPGAFRRRRITIG